MELLLAIRPEEITALQQQYRAQVQQLYLMRQSEFNWVRNRIVELLSRATSQKGAWAVNETLREPVERGLEPFGLSHESANKFRIRPNESQAAPHDHPTNNGHNAELLPAAVAAVDSQT